MCEIQNIHKPPQLPAAHFLSGYVLGEKKMFKTGSVETVSVNSGEQIMFNSFKGERFYYFFFFFFLSKPAITAFFGHSGSTDETLYTQRWHIILLSQNKHLYGVMFVST